VFASFVIGSKYSRNLLQPITENPMLPSRLVRHGILSCAYCKLRFSRLPSGHSLRSRRIKGRGWGRRKRIWEKKIGGVEGGRGKGFPPRILFLLPHPRPLGHNFSRACRQLKSFPALIASYVFTLAVYWLHVVLWNFDWFS